MFKKINRQNDDSQSVCFFQTIIRPVITALVLLKLSLLLLLLDVDTRTNDKRGYIPNICDIHIHSLNPKL